jgi:hypothetical protein
MPELELFNDLNGTQNTWEHELVVAFLHARGSGGLWPESRIL